MQAAPASIKFWSREQVAGVATIARSSITISRRHAHRLLPAMVEGVMIDRQPITNVESPASGRDRTQRPAPVGNQWLWASPSPGCG